MFLLSPALSFFGQELPATRSAFNYRWRMMLALFLSVMSCTCKLQNILESHRCPPLICSLPSSARSDSSPEQRRASAGVCTTDLIFKVLEL